MKLIIALPYCASDHAAATRLLEWIRELDPHPNHHLLLVADNAVPMETKKAIDALGKSIFTSAETITPQCPAAVNGNYHVPAAFMFLKTMGHISECYKPWPWLWMEPDCVPLKSGWADTLAYAYEESPKPYLGSVMKTGGKDDLPQNMFFATAVYPHDAYKELAKFCDGKKAFDVAFSDYVYPRGQNTNLIHHVFGSPTDVPTFKEAKLPTDGPNVGTLQSLHKEAVLFHRNKDGSLIGLLRQCITNATTCHPTLVLPEPMPTFHDEPDVAMAMTSIAEPPKRKPGRPPKQHPVESVTS